ncbi:hypothetical protein GCM10010156_18090 [Planobispora rosea]|uniref:Nucleotidyl transferase n=1 Tax=Planobispora rosea TaxID=35762 RepID=A0A8J3WDP3_PLARO|nr:nucleotidyl transferase AbiEii/AbiGii toxin family protein [Planobispora rosea]GGS59911.1 hypothetical protein GCM10010156_18090 [Planobispora rosea]GIH84091.1 hypothetical protein Pro02_24990 [Planobispora rosea]
MTDFPPFQERVLQIALPVCERFGLALAGGHAMRMHGLTDRPSEDLDFATAAETPLPQVADGLAETFRRAGLEAAVREVTPRLGRLIVTEPVTGQRCELGLLREALQQGSVTVGELPVIGLDDLVGLKMRALHERSLARDVIDVAAVSELYGFRELERLARLHNEEFSIAELVMRLEFVDLIADEEFEAYGLDEERIREIRLFATAWVEDIKLRRADEGDAEYDSDVPELD